MIMRIDTSQKSKEGYEQHSSVTTFIAERMSSVFQSKTFCTTQGEARKQRKDEKEEAYLSVPSIEQPTFSVSSYSPPLHFSLLTISSMSAISSQSLSSVGQTYFDHDVYIDVSL